MQIAELKKKLADAGCSPAHYEIGTGGSDVYCLNNDGTKWNIFYTERGTDSEPIFSSESESEACEFFLQHMCKQPNWHLVGVFQTEAEAEAEERKVKRLGAVPIRNDLPESIMGTPQFRIFVAGRDIHYVNPRK